MQLSSPFPLIFAPLEGITDNIFRQVILKHYPAWDYLYTDFFRLSTNETFKLKHISNFIGPANPKVVLQILTTTKSTTKYNIQQLTDLNIPWLDLNFGCPSKQVTSHRGGSYLLSKPKELEAIIKLVRKNFPNHLSVKIRSGFHDDQHLHTICKILEQEGVDLITLHPRLKTQLYQGKANWKLIAEANQYLNIPIIGNGDILTISDINQIRSQNICQGIMIGRGAIRRPWLATQYKDQLNYTQQEEQQLRHQFIIQLIEAYSTLSQLHILKKLKKITHYLFDKEEDTLKKNLLRTTNLNEYYQYLNQQ